MPKAEAPTPRGSFEDKPFPVLLYEVHQSSYTGTAVFKRGGTVKEVHFEIGQVKFAASNVPEERVGEILCRMGKITTGQLEYTLESAKKQGLLLGKVLVDAGFLKPPDLLHALREQIREIVVDLFAWSEGNYELGAAADRKGDTVKLSMDIRDLVREGVHRIADPVLIFRGLGPMDTTVAITTSVATAMKEFKPTEKERRILGMTGTSISLRDLCNSLPYPAIETCQLVYGLVTFGVLEKK